MLHTKDKGDLAELKVLTDLVERGWKVAIPYGENQHYDLLAISTDHGTEWSLTRHRRIQVKFAESDGEVVKVKCSTASKKAGGVLVTTKYTREFVDVIAVYDRTTDRCLYINVELLGGGKSAVYLRYLPARNGQTTGVRWAEDYSLPI